MKDTYWRDVILARVVKPVDMPGPNASPRAFGALSYDGHLLIYSSDGWVARFQAERASPLPGGIRRRT